MVGGVVELQGHKRDWVIHEVGADAWEVVDRFDAGGDEVARGADA